jgi:hypothetical protein
MTEEERMEAGRRMFQTFAARMFEQRVLTAYKEQVVAERQRPFWLAGRARGGEQDKKKSKKSPKTGLVGNAS